MERPVMKKNAYVTIIASPELSEMRLDELVGRRGLVVEDLPKKEPGRPCIVGRNLYG